jgi:hypothetical protein
VSSGVVRGDLRSQFDIDYYFIICCFYLVGFILLIDLGTRRGEGSASRPGRFLPPGKTLVPIVQEAGWAPGPV